MRKITRIFWHYTDSDDVPMSTVRAWHIARGWQREGYHGLIRKDGSFEAGRPEEMIGAHVTGNNADSLGYSLCGADRLSWYPTDAQYKTAGRVGAEKMRQYGLTIEQATMFHRDAQSTDCPGRLDRARLRQEILGVTAPIDPITLAREEDDDMIYVEKGRRGYFPAGLPEKGKTYFDLTAHGPATVQLWFIRDNGDEPDQKNVGKWQVKIKPHTTFRFEARDFFKAPPGGFTVMVDMIDGSGPVLVTRKQTI